MPKNQQPQQLPFFVYGTLIPGQPNDHLIRHTVVHQQAAVFTYGRLYAFPTFPMLIETDADSGMAITGVLLHIKPQLYDEVRQRLDQLEQYDPHNRADSPYWREIRTVRTAAGQAVAAWLYLGQSHFIPPEVPLIPSGSWLAHCQAPEQHESMRHWWRTHGVDLLFGKLEQSD